VVLITNHCVEPLFTILTSFIGISKLLRWPKQSRIERRRVSALPFSITFKHIKGALNDERGTTGKPRIQYFAVCLSNTLKLVEDLQCKG